MNQPEMQNAQNLLNELQQHLRGMLITRISMTDHESPTMTIPALMENNHINTMWRPMQIVVEQTNHGPVLVLYDETNKEISSASDPVSLAVFISGLLAGLPIGRRMQRDFYDELDRK